MEYHNDASYDVDLVIDSSVDEGSALLPNQSAGSSENLFVDAGTMAPKKSPQILNALAACLGAMAFGAAIGFSSPAGPLLLNGGGGVNLTERQNDWVSSALTIGALFGGPVGGVTMGTIGRRMTMISSGIPYMAGWALIIGGQNFAMLLIGRLICGLCVGITTVTVPTYVSEISSANVRGTLSSLFQLMVTIGVFYGYVWGPAFDSFRLIAVACAILPVLHCITMFFCKESPLFLLKRNKEIEAISVLQYFRGNGYDIRKETQNMKDSIDEAKRNKITFAELKKPYVLKPYIIAILLMVFQQFSGINAVLFNLSLIFQEAGTSISHNTSAIIIAAVQIVFTLVSTSLIDRLGRRILLQISSFFMFISLVGLGAFFYLKEKVDDPQELLDIVDNLGWLPLTCMVGFISAFAIGYGPIPWIMMAEMFFPNVKEFAVSSAASSNWLCAFITTVTFAMMKDSIGSYGVYWMFAGFCATSFIFCCLFVPETKGKTIEEITELFGRTPHHANITAEEQN